MKLIRIIFLVLFWTISLPGMVDQVPVVEVCKTNRHTLVTQIKSEFKDALETVNKKHKPHYSATKKKFKKQFGNCDFTKNLNSIENFEDYLFELAFEKGNYLVAEWFLNHGCHMNQLYKDKGFPSQGTTPLIAAIENERIAVVQLLLSAGANPHGSGCNGGNKCKHPNESGNDFVCKNLQPLAIAAFRGNVPIFYALINARAKDRFGCIMKSAVNGGNPEMVSALCKLRYNDGSWHTLRTAVRQGNTPVVKLLLENNGLEDLPSENYYNFNYADLIVDSINNEKSDITGILLDARPTYDVNSVSRSFEGSYTRPLLAALQKNNFEVARKLIKRGAWVNPPVLKEFGSDYIQHEESNPLYVAARADNLKAIEFLLQNGADQNHLAISRALYNYRYTVYSKPNPPRPIREFIVLDRSENLPNSKAIIQMLQNHIQKKKIRKKS
ncbi:MAG: hypothetical protein AMXMBFR12_04500 [Candidatus Babeliales bacterium]